MKNAIIFNITIKVAKDLSLSWLKDMQTDYLPPCTDGQIIVASQINLIHGMGAEDNADNENTYAIQFTFANSEMFEKHKLTSMQKFLTLLDSTYRGKYVYFTTTMERLYINSIINK